ITGLALENRTDFRQSVKAYPTHLSGFEKGNVLFGQMDAFGQLLRADFALGQHHVEIDDDAHCQTMLRFSSSMCRNSCAMRAKAKNRSPTIKEEISFEPIAMTSCRWPGGLAMVMAKPTRVRTTMLATAAAMASPPRRTRRSGAAG